MRPRAVSIHMFTSLHGQAPSAVRLSIPQLADDRSARRRGTRTEWPAREMPSRASQRSRCASRRCSSRSLHELGGLVSHSSVGAPTPRCSSAELEALGRQHAALVIETCALMPHPSAASRPELTSSRSRAPPIDRRRSRCPGKSPTFCLSRGPLHSGVMP
jgi:hypothetical protein